MKTWILSVIVLYVVLATSFASGDSSSEAAESSERIGPGKAVEAFDKEQGFKLSEKSASAMGVSFKRLDPMDSWQLPKEAIVHLKQSTGVYRRYEGWILFVLVKIKKSEGNVFLVTSEDLEPGDEVAISGATFLRMTDTDLNSGTVDSCTH